MPPSLLPAVPAHAYRVAAWIVAIAITACSGGDPPIATRSSRSTAAVRQPSAVTTTPGDLTPETPGDWSVAERIVVPGTPPFRMAVGYGSVWVLQRGPQGCTESAPCSLSRIDPQTNRVVGDPTPLGDPWDLAVGAGSVWVTQFDGRLLRIDARTGQIQGRIDARPVYFGSAIAFGAGFVWTGNDDEGNDPASVGKVDPNLNRLVGTVEARSPQSITFGHGAVWVADHAGRLVKIDPETMRVLASTPLRFGAHGVIATKGAVYVADSHDHRLVVADPGTARVRRVVELPIGPIYPVVGGGSLWTTSEVTWSDPSLEDDRVVRIDPRSLSVVQTLHVGSNAPSLTFGFASAWVALRSGVVVRLSR